jgi:hypothetical protein
VLFVNVPITLTAAAIAPRLIDESRAQTSERSVDFAGAALVSGGLVAGLYSLMNANTVGWGSLQTIGLFAVAAILLSLFVWVESRVTAPLVPLRIFRLGMLRGANIAMVPMAGAMVGMFFILTLYQQDIQGYSALKSGLSQLPLGLMLITVAGLAGPLVERLGAKPVLVTGLTLFTAGVAWLSQIPLHGSYLNDILGPSLIIAAGLGLAFVAITTASVSGVQGEHAGVAGGLINMTQQVGGALGLAILTAVAASHTHAAVHSLASVNDGFRAALIVAASIAAASALLAAVALPAARHRAPTAMAAAAAAG